MKYRMAAALLSLAGFFVSLYLYLYKIGKIGTLACGTGGCETVQASPFSRFLGLEVALYGVVGYVFLLILSMETLRRPAARLSSLLLLLCSGIGLAFTFYLTYIELFVIKAICRWCVGSAVIITLIFIVALLDWRRRAAPLGSPSQ
ncbi:MAG TPA: vitamin K epoxide reductase family protein [Gemmatimonadales bacterium]|jgi:uncharacterized membrane protein